MGVKGNSGGKKGRSGRKSKAEELGVAAQFDLHWPASQRAEVIRRMYEIAIGENDKAAVTAAMFLFGYTYGKPRESVEHSGKDGEPFQIIVSHVTRKPEED